MDVSSPARTFSSFFSGPESLFVRLSRHSKGINTSGNLVIIVPGMGLASAIKALL